MTIERRAPPRRSENVPKPADGKRPELRVERPNGDRIVISQPPDDEGIWRAIERLASHVPLDCTWYVFVPS